MLLQHANQDFLVYRVISHVLLVLLVKDVEVCVGIVLSTIVTMSMDV